jgi:hypothetical protein
MIVTNDDKYGPEFLDSAVLSLSKAIGLVGSPLDVRYRSGKQSALLSKSSGPEGAVLADLSIRKRYAPEDRPDGLRAPLPFPTAWVEIAQVGLASAIGRVRRSS